MYKDSSTKKKEKKKRFRCEVSELYKLMSCINHVISLDIIFFWCDLCNVRVESLTEIELKSEKTLNFKLLYSMSWEELQVLWQYLNKHLAKSFIQSSCSSFVFSILFVKKLNKNLHFCINYWILNAIIIWNQYLIFLIQETLN